MKPAPDAGGASALFRIAGVAASLACGAMVASLFSLKSAPTGLGFELNAGAIVAFPVAAVCAWFYWRMVVRMAGEKNPEQSKKKFFVFSAGLLLAGVVAFLYPLKFIPAEKRKDVFIGLALAATVLTGVGVVMWKVRKFLEADLQKSEAEEQADE